MLYYLILICSIFPSGLSQLVKDNSNFSSEESFSSEGSSKLKIGIIGGGIGGTATAYFLKNDLKDNILIDLYEPNVIGGRLATSSSLGFEYETGGSIIHPQNHYMNQFIDKLRLKKTYGCESKAGIFNGEHYSFVESNWSYVNAIKAFLHYGFDIFKLKNRNNKMLNQFFKIYEHQKMGLTFKNVQDLLYSMNNEFPSLLKKSLSTFLKENGLHDNIINDIGAASTRANYGQMPNIHAFVGSVSLAAAASTGLWSVAEGNKKVPEGLLQHSGATRINKSVTKISQINGKFRVWAEGKLGNSEKQDYSTYDAVVIAAPLTKDHNSIAFDGFPEKFEFPGTYEKIICTLVRGELNSTTFKFKETGSNVDEILTNNPDLYYNSVGRQYPKDTEDPCSSDINYKVFKVFSHSSLSEHQLSILFNKVDAVEVVPWLAYPHYESSETLGRFELVPGLYYNNAIELAASAMEMSSIAAKNTALLIEDYLKGPLERPRNFKEEL